MCVLHVPLPYCQGRERLGGRATNRPLCDDQRATFEPQLNHLSLAHVTLLVLVEHERSGAGERRRSSSVQRVIARGVACLRRTACESSQWPVGGIQWRWSLWRARRAPVASASIRTPSQSEPGLRADWCVSVLAACECLPRRKRECVVCSVGVERRAVREVCATMNEERDQVLANIRNGTYLVSDAKDSTSAQWKKFRQVVDRFGKVAATSKSPCGYAVCRQCGEVCPLGRRGGMSALEKHRCHKPKGEIKRYLAHYLLVIDSKCHLSVSLCPSLTLGCQGALSPSRRKLTKTRRRRSAKRR